MSAGRLNKRVTLKNVVRVSDGAGGWEREDATETTVWADVREATAKEEERSKRREQRIDRMIIIRWRPDLAGSFGPEAVATFQDNAGRTRTLAIKTCWDPDERSRWLYLGALEGGPV